MGSLWLLLRRDRWYEDLLGARKEKVEEGDSPFIHVGVLVHLVLGLGHEDGAQARGQEGRDGEEDGGLHVEGLEEVNCAGRDILRW